MSEHLAKDPAPDDRAGRLKAIIEKLAAGAAARGGQEGVPRPHQGRGRGRGGRPGAVADRGRDAGGGGAAALRGARRRLQGGPRAGRKGGAHARPPGAHLPGRERRGPEARPRPDRWPPWPAASSGQDRGAGLRPIIVHFERKENQLFPFLERTGFTGPSKVMWGKHDEIRTGFREPGRGDSGAGTTAAARPRPGTLSGVSA
ncbi:MAG: hemerythrin domain-containing protein [Desulfomicrobium escambiense]|nr:hemerythrin domain-containing protein [Desulfomicrobium escambiense]